MHLLDQFGAWIVFLNTLVHEAGLPAPLTPTVLVAAAAMSDVAKQTAQLTAAIVVGSVLGNAIWFALGRKYGSRVLTQLCRLSLSPHSCVTKTGAAFGRWGSSLLIIGRFIPGVSLVAPPIAGALGMTWRRFLWLSALGAALWALPIILLGYFLKEVLASLFDALQDSRVGGALVIIGVVAIYLLWRYVRRQQAMRIKGVPRIDPATLNAALSTASAPIVIDVRSDNAAAVPGPHIAAARFHSLNTLRTMPLEALGGRPVVLYCACPEEASAAMGALVLQGRGHLDARALQGGIDAWIAAGYESTLARGAPHVARNLEHEL
ncbi:MAG TPA: VTT domain-containing protein [Burkholderiales bacterium]|nr:VTT domain-containing protein [Burkholderiales bacterium]